MTAIPDDVKLPAPGRPPFKWTPEIEDKILDAFMEGKSFRDFMGPDREEGLPCVPVFFKHLRDDEGFAKRYALAREFQADIEFEEIKEIADNSSNDWMESNDPENPGYRFNGDHVQRSKLRIDARKWRAAKMNRKYGDKVDVANTHANPDGSPLGLMAQICGTPIVPQPSKE